MHIVEAFLLRKLSYTVDKAGRFFCVAFYIETTRFLDAFDAFLHFNSSTLLILSVYTNYEQIYYLSPQPPLSLEVTWYASW